MSGTLDINESAVWMPAGWVFDHVLASVAAQLEGSDSALAKALLEARTEVRGYGDLRHLEGTRFRLLVEAAERAYAHLRATGPSAFHDPSFYPGFLKQFQALRAMLRADKRVGGA